MTNTATFSATVVIPYATYMVTINDVSKFSSFGDANLGSADFNDSKNILNTLYGINEAHTGAQNEVHFLKALSDLNAGLTVMKMDSNGNFNQMNLNSDNAAVTITGCN